MRNKKQKWSINRKRLRDALESNAHNNQLGQMVENFSLMKPDEFNACKDRLLFLSLKSCSKECAILLIEKGATCDLRKVFYDCHWKIIDKVYILLSELYGSDIGFGIGSKTSLISRLIEPSKVNANVERAEYVFQLLKDGFFSAEDIRNTCNLLYKDKNDSKRNIVMILRELTLNELGI